MNAEASRDSIEYNIDVGLGSGRHVGAYELLHPLGRGGMAEVWVGRHVETGGLAAVKLLSGGSTRLQAQVVREAAAIARLSHPHIVALYEIGEGYLVTRYVQGLDLHKRLRSGIEPGELLRLIRTMGDALGHAHDRGVVHCDVKPSNILLDGRGEPLLADFGLASLREAPDGPTPGGTPDFMAPEQRQGAPGPAVDQYALARTLLTGLIGGALPTDPEAALHQLPPETPTRVRAAIVRATAPDPAARFADIRAFVAALDDADLPSIPRHRPPLRRPAHAFTWCTRPEQVTRVGEGLFRAEYRLSRLAETGALPAAACDAFKRETGYADFTWSMWAADRRLGRIDETLSLGRASDVIVLMHGLFTTREMWSQLAAALARDNGQAVVVAPDLHGFGESPFAEALPADPSPAAALQAVRSWMSMLGLSQLRVVMVGSCYSAAGLLQASDTLLPEVVCRVALTPSLPAMNARYRRTLSLAAAVLPAIGGIPALRRLAPQRLCTTQTPEVKKMLSNAAVAMPGRRLARMMRALLQTAPAEANELGRCLVVTTPDDPVAPSAILEESLRAWGLPERQIYRLASGGHYPLLPNDDGIGWCARNADELAAIVDASVDVTRLRDVSPAAAPRSASDSG